MVTPNENGKPVIGFRCITKAQWQSLAVLYGIGLAIVIGSVVWLSSYSDDAAGRRLGTKLLFFGIMFITLGLLATRNLLRVMKRGQTALYAPPTSIDLTVEAFSNKVVTGDRPTTLEKDR